MDEKERSQQEMEYILDGITTRMQMAMESITKTSKDATEKMAESNRIMKSAIMCICVAMILALLISIGGTIITIQMIHANHSQPAACVCEVTPDEAVSKLGSGAGN